MPREDYDAEINLHHDHTVEPLLKPNHRQAMKGKRQSISPQVVKPPNDLRLNGVATILAAINECLILRDLATMEIVDTQEITTG